MFSLKDNRLNIICVWLCLLCGLGTTSWQRGPDTELEMGPEINDLLSGMPGYIAGK